MNYTVKNPPFVDEDSIEVTIEDGIYFAEHPFETLLIDPRVKSISHDGPMTFAYLEDNDDEPYEIKVDGILQDKALSFITQLIPESTSVSESITSFYTEEFNASVTCTLNTEPITFTIEKYNDVQPIDTFLENHNLDITDAGKILDEIETKGTIFVFGKTIDPTLETIASLTHLAPQHNIVSNIKAVNPNSITNSTLNRKITIEKFYSRSEQEDHAQIFHVHSDSLRTCRQRTGHMSGIYVDCTTTPHEIHHY